jgi:hypothetical protein
MMEAEWENRAGYDDNCGHHPDDFAGSSEPEQHDDLDTHREGHSPSSEASFAATTG